MANNNNIYPLEAEDIKAHYDTQTLELILSAECELQPVTSNIKFVRVPWVGGLKFVLEGRVLAVMGKKQGKHVEQRFKMPPPTDPFVIVVYAGDLKGKPVQIQFKALENSIKEGGSKLPIKVEGPEPSTEQEPPKLPQTLVLGNEEINVINGRTFTIHVASEVPRLGSINMDHDPKYLDLLTAGIRDKDIYWTFKALQLTSDTQIRLFVSGGIAQYVYQKVYDVFIGLADGPGVELTPDGLIPPPRERIERGINKIKEKYPDAQLHDVDYRPPLPRSCESPYDLSSLTVDCLVNDGKQLASVRTVGYGPFGPIELRERLLDDRQNIQWPVKIDIPEADELMKKAGFNQPYTGASLDFSILPGGDQEANYTFSMIQLPGGPSAVSVGVNDGKVTPFGQALPPKGT